MTALVGDLTDHAPPDELVAALVANGGAARAAADASRALVPVDHDAVAGLVATLARAERPVFIAGRGARAPGSRAALEPLAERCGALVATSAVANGLFAGNPWALGPAAWRSRR